MTVPPFSDLKTLVRKHVEAMAAEATALFGEHGGDLTDSEHRQIDTATDIIARHLLFRYSREAGMSRARARGQA